MQIKKASYLISSPDWEKCPQGIKPEYAFIGRSNVGKSSLINMLCQNDKLAKTSASPGKTQMINHFDIVSSSISKTDGKEYLYEWYLVDLPGYGFAKVSISSRRRWEQMIEHYLRKRENLIQEFLLQLKKWEVPFSLVFTKADKESQRVVSKNVKDFLQAMRKDWMFLPMHFVTSAVKKSGRDKLLGYINELNEQFAE